LKIGVASVGTPVFQESKISASRSFFAFDGTNLQGIWQKTPIF
jgi:hypothetical protein